MAFTAADVKTLREMTGVGMLDCKKALAETDGDMDKAVELLREKGLAAAQKKAGRIAAEGMAYAEVFSDGAALVEVNAETDFVAKNDQFIEFVKDVCYVVGKWGPVDMDTLMTLPYRKTGLTVQQMLQEKVLVIGENIKIRRFVRYAEGVNVPYIHMGGKIGVLLLVENNNPATFGADAFRTFYHDVALQIAAAKPSYVRKEEVPTEALNKEREILRAQALNEGKPEKIVDKMVEGRIEKYYKEVCLLEQPFVKDPDKSIAKLMGEVAKEIGAELNVVSFERFERGEGIEKRKDNFAEEIAAQMAAKK